MKENKKSLATIAAGALIVAGSLVWNIRNTQIDLEHEWESNLARTEELASMGLYASVENLKTKTLQQMNAYLANYKRDPLSFLETNKVRDLRAKILGVKTAPEYNPSSTASYSH